MYFNDWHRSENAKMRIKVRMTHQKMGLRPETNLLSHRAFRWADSENPERVSMLAKSSENINVVAGLNCY